MPYEFAPIDRAPEHLFSRTQIPPSPHLEHIPPGKHRWLSLDSEASFNKNPHPALGADSVEYAINRHGFRTTDLDRAADDGRNKLRIVCIGSSGAFGTGLPESATFPMVFRDLLQAYTDREAIVWNLSLGGTSADFVSRMLYSAIPVLRPHMVLLTCFPFNRREFFSEMGLPYVSTATPHWQQRFTNPQRWQFDDVSRRICNPYNDLTNFVANLKLWESLCDDASVPWLFVTESLSEHVEPLGFLLRDPRKMVLPGIMTLIRNFRNEPSTGYARDMLHAGVEPTRVLGGILFEKLMEVYPQQVSAYSIESGAKK